MGHFYRSPIKLVGITNLAADLALWAITRTTQATSKHLFIWQIELGLFVDGVASATAGDRFALRVQRATTAIYTGGGAGVISPVGTAAPATSMSVIQSATGLTGAPAGTILDYFSIPANVATSGNTFLRCNRGTEEDQSTPLAVVTGTEQLALVNDMLIRNTASHTLSIHGSIYFEERG